MTELNAATGLANELGCPCALLEGRAPLISKEGFEPATSYQLLLIVTYLLLPLPWSLGPYALGPLDWAPIYLLF